jgi:hypothetical protein
VHDALAGLEKTRASVLRHPHPVLRGLRALRRVKVPQTMALWEFARFVYNGDASKAPLLYGRRTRCRRDGRARGYRAHRPSGGVTVMQQPYAHRTALILERTNAVLPNFDRYNVKLDMLDLGNPFTFSLWYSTNARARGPPSCVR